MSRRRGGWDNDWGEFETIHPMLEEYVTPPDARLFNHPQPASPRGKFGTQWWGKAWLKSLDELAGEGRLDRGRSYARNGSVHPLEISRGIAYARVRGTARKPYKTAVTLTPFTDAEWDTVLERLGAQLIYTAKLLAGEMPGDIEDLLRDAGVSLFPRSLNEIKFYCSCPDSVSLCKHAAAVYYLVAEQLDDDPFVLFHLRGRTREQMLTALRTGRSDQQGSHRLAADTFWTDVQPPPALEPPAHLEIPAIFAELGDPPLDEKDATLLRTLYQRIAIYARDYLSESEE